MGAKISGFTKVTANLNRQIKKIKGFSMKGLLEGSILIRRDMDVTPPLVPIDLGNLRASWFVSSFFFPRGPSVVMGFSANYAIYLHEDLTRKNYKRPGSGPKFLEEAVKRNTSEILAIVAKTTHII